LKNSSFQPQRAILGQTQALIYHVVSMDDDAVDDQNTNPAPSATFQPKRKKNAANSMHMPSVDRTPVEKKRMGLSERIAQAEFSRTIWQQRE
jgi:hypothetical protein